MRFCTLLKKLNYTYISDLLKKNSTGDNVQTAISVAKECGILSHEETVISVSVVPVENKARPEIFFNALGLPSMVNNNTIFAFAINCNAMYAFFSLYFLCFLTLNSTSILSTRAFYYYVFIRENFFFPSHINTLNIFIHVDKFIQIYLWVRHGRSIIMMGFERKLYLYEY